MHGLATLSKSRQVKRTVVSWPRPTDFHQLKLVRILKNPPDDVDKTSRNPKGTLGSLYDPRNGSEAFSLKTVSVEKSSFEPERTNYFAIYWIEAGSGVFWADAAQHAFHQDQLLFFVPYQYSRFEPHEPLRATVLYFHANFLCVETFHSETGCSGTLFNDTYGLPLITLDEPTKLDVVGLLARMRREQDERRLGYQDALLASMKLLLIVATRLKARQSSECAAAVGDFRHPVLGPLRDLIEKNYRTLHAPSDYADLLHMSAKTLGRHVREHLGKTLTDLIRERILTHAKWQLLHTLRPVKEIAAEIGFQDELYFSRFVKKGTGISPTFFREFETEIRGGSNLSMSFAHAPILGTPSKVDDSVVST